MMAAAQPFLSGAISKTVNMPNDVTPQDIADAYFWGWELGLKAIAIYRDGSKQSQPLNTANDTEDAKAVSEVITKTVEKIVYKPRRERLQDTRQSLTHKFSIGGHEGYLCVGLYPDGRPGELFITMAKEGSTIGGIMDAFGTAISMALQYGVPLEVLVNKFSHTRFEPMGHTTNPDIRIAKSVVDYIFRYLGIQFLAGYREASVPSAAPAEPKATGTNGGSSTAKKSETNGSGAKPVSLGGNGPSVEAPNTAARFTGAKLDLAALERAGVSRDLSDERGSLAGRQRPVCPLPKRRSELRQLWQHYGP